MKIVPVILAAAALALSGCQYVVAKKRVDEMKAASASRVTALQNATAQLPAVATPPAAIESAQTSGAQWYYIGGAISGLVGLGLLAATFRAAGVTLLAGALAMPLIVNVATLPLTNIICAVILTAAITFIAAWFIVRKFKYANTPSPGTPTLAAQAATTG